MSAGDYVPTGRRRHRIERKKRLFGRRSYLFVLQVEVTGYEIVWPGHQIDRTFWRDARLGDLTTVEGVRYGDERLAMGAP